MFYLLKIIHSLMRNPVTHKQHYRSYVIYKLPQVKVLDFRKVKQKVGVSLVDHVMPCRNTGERKGS